LCLTTVNMVFKIDVYGITSIHMSHYTWSWQTIRLEKFTHRHLLDFVRSTEIQSIKYITMPNSTLLRVEIIQN
jgi:hypothetical protein